MPKFFAALIIKETPPNFKIMIYLKDLEKIPF